MVLPSTEKAEGLGVKVWSATVNASVATGVGGGFVREIVLLPIANGLD